MLLLIAISGLLCHVQAHQHAGVRTQSGRPLAALAVVGCQCCSQGRLHPADLAEPPRQREGWGSAGGSPASVGAAKCLRPWRHKPFPSKVWSRLLSAVQAAWPASSGTAMRSRRGAAVTCRRSRASGAARSPSSAGARNLHASLGPPCTSAYKSGVGGLSCWSVCRVWDRLRAVPALRAACT